MRLYIPIDQGQLKSFYVDNEVPVTSAFAVNETIQKQFADLEVEEQEYVAFTTASDRAIESLDFDKGWTKRIVLTVEYPTEQTTWVQQNEYALLAPIKQNQLIAIHLDESHNGTQLKKIQEERNISALDDLDMLWYHPSELSQLINVN